MRCPRCRNEDRRYFHQDSKGFYCRKCIRFGKIYVHEALRQKPLYKPKIQTQMHLDYELTSVQQDAIAKVELLYEHHNKVLVYAACGAGKTEITLAQIQQHLAAGKKVGYAIARRQVVIEIAKRLSEAFPNIHVVKVCGGYTNIVDGDLIVCTTHQLYRYHKCFDLLILDEMDAFPFANNDVLQQLAYNACCGKLLLLSATPESSHFQEVKDGYMGQVSVFERPHKQPLVVPKVYRLPFAMQMVVSLLLVLFKKGKWIIFMPKITQVERMEKLCKHICRCRSISSKTKQKDELMEAFNRGDFNLVFATTILERGITIKGVNVAIVSGEHKVYTKASLIQMVGRVGRKFDAPTGLAYIFCKEQTKEIVACQKEIIMMNRKAKIV